MRLRTILFTVIAIASVGIACGQSIIRTADGQKLIKRVISDRLEVDGSVHPGSDNTTYEMTYFPDGRLQSITLSHLTGVGKNREAERIWIESKKYHLAYLYNGIKDPNLSSVFNFRTYRRHGLDYPIIKSIARNTKEYDRAGFTLYFSNLFLHDRYRSIKVELDGSGEKIDSWRDRACENVDYVFTQEYDSFSRNIFPGPSLQELGFKQEIHIIEANNGFIYNVYDTKEMLRQEKDGNLLRYIDQPDPMDLGDIFTENINDTNMNLQFFFEVGMPELMTEWIPVRSKNLIEYEEGKKYGEEIKYRKRWEYEYDINGNLVGATVIRKDMAPYSKYRIKIEYIYE